MTKKITLGFVFWLWILIITSSGLLMIKASDPIGLFDGSVISASTWNSLLNQLNTAIGWSGPESLIAWTGDTLTADKRNALVTKVDTYTNIPDCNADNWWNCKITQSNKNTLDSDLAAWNIKAWVNVFWVTGSLMWWFPLRENICQNSNGTFGKVTLNWRIWITCWWDSGRLSAQANNWVSYSWQSSTNTCWGYQRISYTWQCVGSSSTPSTYPACVNADGTYGQVSINPWNIWTTWWWFGWRNIWIIPPNGSTYYTTPWWGATIWNYVYWSCN